MYSSEDVCAMLDASVDIASIGSDVSENESDSDSESEFDLSNPEAGLSDADEGGGFISQTYEEPDQYFSSKDSASCSGLYSLPLDDGNSEAASVSRGRGRGFGSRGLEVNLRRGQSTRRRSQSRRPRGAVRTRARGRRRSSRSTARSSTEQPTRPPLLVKDIRTKADIVKKDFTFAPNRPEGFYIPSEVDSSNPEELFKLFFAKEIVEYICKSSVNMLSYIKMISR